MSLVKNFELTVFPEMELCFLLNFHFPLADACY